MQGQSDDRRLNCEHVDVHQHDLHSIKSAILLIKSYACWVHAVVLTLIHRLLEITFVLVLSSQSHGEISPSSTIIDCRPKQQVNWLKLESGNLPVCCYCLHLPMPLTSVYLHLYKHCCRLQLQSMNKIFDIIIMCTTQKLITIKDWFNLE